MANPSCQLLEAVPPGSSRQMLFKLPERLLGLRVASVHKHGERIVVSDFLDNLHAFMEVGDLRADEIHARRSLS